jgi:lysophospholipase L1-like esterase
MLEEVALNADLMLPDGIHPKETAQPLIAEFMYLQLKPLLTESN